mgnify:CR=1 FL=1
MCCVVFALFSSHRAVAGAVVEHPLPYGRLRHMPAPKHYIAYHCQDGVEVDGTLDEPCWASTTATDAFVDIVGPTITPWLSTTAKVGDLHFQRSLWCWGCCSSMLESNQWASQAATTLYLITRADLDVGVVVMAIGFETQYYCPLLLPPNPCYLPIMTLCIAVVTTMSRRCCGTMTTCTLQLRWRTPGCLHTKRSTTGVSLLQVEGLIQYWRGGCYK